MQAVLTNPHAAELAAIAAADNTTERHAAGEAAPAQLAQRDSPHLSCDEVRLFLYVVHPRACTSYVEVSFGND